MEKKEIVCSLFHNVLVLNQCHFIDTVSGKSVGRYYCPKCDEEFLSNKKKFSYRVYTNLKNNGTN